MTSLEPAVTWIKVEKPTFDLIGVVLGSFKLAGFLLLAALVLGLVFGAALIRSRRRLMLPPMDDVSLHLDRADAGGRATP
ncbi:MAG TPA: hypothetical protein VMT70_10040 [Vicinamibacteria bacterium]|nr:hypothetical protein [Vicinamibacteria bacterium]